jgi:hypothetical protein
MSPEVRSGSDSAVAITLAARPVYPRKLTTCCKRPSRQLWANCGSAQPAALTSGTPGLPARV